MSNVAQYTTLLPNEVLTRIERMRLQPLRRRTNRMRGEHISGKGGQSLEFSDYRDYAAGDDLRYVDWNIFSRLQQPYLKLYAHEEEMQTPILLDTSASMRFEGKFDLARQLAGALGVMGLMSVEKVSIYSCGPESKRPPQMTPRSGRGHLKAMFAFLESLTAEGGVSIDAAVDRVLQHHRGKGAAYVISDFLTTGDMTRALNRLHAAGLEIHGIQILGPTERNPELTGDLRFVDAETGSTLDVSSVGELLGLYHAHLQGLVEDLEAQCRKRAGRFISCDSTDALSQLLFDRLVRAGWIR